MGSRPGLTLMDRVLPGLIKNMICFGLKKNKKIKTQSRSDSSMDFGPNPTHLQLKQNY